MVYWNEYLDILSGDSQQHRKRNLVRLEEIVTSKIGNSTIHDESLRNDREMFQLLLHRYNLYISDSSMSSKYGTV